VKKDLLIQEFFSIPSVSAEIFGPYPANTWRFFDVIFWSRLHHIRMWCNHYVNKISIDGISWGWR